MTKHPVWTAVFDNNACDFCLMYSFFVVPPFFNFVFGEHDLRVVTIKFVILSPP